MSRLLIAPVRKTIQVAAARARAFEVFSARISAWWPRGSHSILRAPLQEVIIEPRVGGRWFHRGVDGSECDTGRVLAWSPPARVVLGWQINGRWQYEANVETEVDIRFVEIAPEITEIRLEHRHLERFAETAEALRQGVDGPNGWPILLRRYADHVSPNACRNRRPRIVLAIKRAANRSSAEEHLSLPYGPGRNSAVTHGASEPGASGIQAARTLSVRQACAPETLSKINTDLLTFETVEPRWGLAEESRLA